MNGQTPEDAIAGRQNAAGFSGVLPWVSKWRELLFGALVLGVVWLLTHPVIPAKAAGTITGSQVNSVDAADIVGHVAPTATPVPAPSVTAKPRLEVAQADFAPVTPLPTQGAVAQAPPPPAAPPPPTTPPTLSPAAIAAQKRAEEDRAALDAPLVVQTPPAAAQGAQPPAQRVASDVAPPQGPFLAPHTEIDVTLYTSIDSTIPGGITGFVGRDVLDFFKRVVVIPANSKVVGHMATTSLQPGQSRIGVVWEGILLPNGHEIMLEDAPGIDLTGTTGFGAAIDNHTRKELVNVIAFSLLAAGAQLAQPQNNGCNSNGFGCTPSVGQAIGQAIGSQIASLGTAAYNRSTQIPPTAHVVEGAQVGVMITNYLALKPWDPTAQ